MKNSTNQDQFDPTKLKLFQEEGVELSDDEAKSSLEGQLAGLVEEVASYDEKIAQLEAVKARYQRIIDSSPGNENAAQEVVELQNDIALLIESREHYVIQRQAVREQIKARSSPELVNRSVPVGGAGDLLSKIESMRLRQKTVRQHVSMPSQTADLFGDIEAHQVSSVAVVNREKKLLPVRHLNRDFFLADLVDYAFKDDAATMEAPVFSLATKPDLTTWTWQSKDSKKRMEVTPSSLGRATIHDKDVLIYVTSQMTEALNRERHDTSKRVVRFTVYDYLVTTNRHTSGREYDSFQVALRRLSGTRIYTNIETGDTRIKRDFGIIDGWEIVEKSEDDEKMIAVEVTLSEWLYNAIQAHEVLTLHPNYFRLRKPTDRRIYELARKHCGHQAQWSIGLPLLHEKSGSRATIYEFHEAIKALSDSDHLPDYRVSVSNAARVSEVKITFYTRDAKRLAQSLL